MRISLLWFLALVCCTGCSQTQKDQEASSAKLTAFHGFPAGVEGCSCYFSTSEKEFINEEYVFISDLDSTAYIAINGKPVILKLQESTRRADLPEEREYEEVYSDGIYTVVVKVQHKENIADEVWWNTGEIRLLFKGTQTNRNHFIGECGC